MIQITFPDGNVKSFEKGISAIEIAKSISHGLAKNVLSAKFNNQTIEPAQTLFENGTLQFFTWDNPEGKQAFWHSSAHVLAQTLETFYPKIKLTIGPPIENGFYYDVDLGDETLSENDFKKIEDKFLELARQKAEFKMRAVSKTEALNYYKQKNNQYKV